MTSSSSTKEFARRRSFGFTGEPLEGVLRIPCYKRTEPGDPSVDSRSGVDQEDGVEMRLLPQKPPLARKLLLRAELLVRMAHLTYPALVRQIRGVLQVAIPRTPSASGEWLFARLLTKYRYCVEVLNGMLLEQLETVLRQIKSVTVSS
jgi:hypothetical protein